MTVANNYAPIRQLGNGTTTVFSGTWSMISAAYANIQLESVSTGVRTPVTQGTGASQAQVAITSSGFSVTFNTAPTSSYYVDISRVTGLDQTNSFTTSKGFQGPVEENSLDKLTCMVQDAAYNAAQAIAIPVGESLNTDLPAAAVRANGYLAFDANGNVIVTTGNGSAIPISAAMTPVVQATTLQNGLVALHSPITQIQVTKVTSSGTFSRQTNTQYLTTEAWGGGGGGGGTPTPSTGYAGGGGGGAGGYSKKTVSASTFGASQTITIGAAGAGAVGAANGGSGGTTSVGSLCVANGGQGGGQGNLSGAAGGGGAAGTGDIAAPGALGGIGFGGGSTAIVGTSGYGASSSVGEGGYPLVTSGTGLTGISATGYASGGSGGSAQNYGGPTNGGAGSQGLVIVTEYISQ